MDPYVWIELLIATTQIGEFMAVMAKWRVPRSVVIPVAIMFRYFPTVKEDWIHIKEAMALRGIGLSPWHFVKNPEAVIDALYLPVLVTASKAADELSASAITRGIENPRMRSKGQDEYDEGHIPGAIPILRYSSTE